MQEHKNRSTSSEPGHFLAELLISPLYAGSLSLISPYFIFSIFPIFIFFIFKELRIDTYLFQRWKRDLELLRIEEVVPSEKYVIDTSEIIVNDSPSAYST